LYRDLPPKKPDYVTEKAFGWDVDILYKLPNGKVRRILGRRIYLPKWVCDIKNNVVKKLYLDQSEWEIITNLVLIPKECPMAIRFKR